MSDDSFAHTAQERDAFQRRAQDFVGLTVARVTYADYEAYDGFDSVGYSIEFETTEGRFFTITWDTPGWTTGLSLREIQMAGYAFAEVPCRSR